VVVSDPLLPIGQFARLCRLSLKQLRHYDELGLLPPARVDPHTGYRYYHPEQARTALSIGLLRSLDVPLPAIARVLDTGVDALDGVRESMEADLARRRRTLSTLTRILADGLPVADVHLSREPPRRVVAVRGSGAVAHISVVTSRCAEQLTVALETAGARPVGPLVGRFPLDLTDEFTVTMAAEVDTSVPDADPDLLPGGLFAVATHVGPYDQITLTAHALLAWVGQHGHVPVDELREVYVSDPRSTPADRLVTQVMIRMEEFS
jgi:DNA-binding transcriptional MerR regulator